MEKVEQAKFFIKNRTGCPKIPCEDCIGVDICFCFDIFENELKKINNLILEKSYRILKEHRVKKLERII